MHEHKNSAQSCDGLERGGENMQEGVSLMWLAGDLCFNRPAEKGPLIG
jgi:hypothetical protein